MKCLSRWLAAVCLVLVSTITVSNSQAGVMVNGTRFVYPSQEKEVGVKVFNQGKGPVLIKGWIDKGDVSALPEEIKVPFTLTSPIFRLDGDKEKVLRLSYTGGATLPEDRESLFWLNIMEVPPRPYNKKDEEKSTMQFAFRYRLKLFFRPEGLSGSAEDAAKELIWSKNERQGQLVLKVTNNRPYYVSLAEVKLKHDGQITVAEPETIAPFSSHDFVLKKLVQKRFSNDVGLVDYRWINEWGGVVENSKPLAHK